MSSRYQLVASGNDLSAVFGADDELAQLMAMAGDDDDVLDVAAGYQTIMGRDDTSDPMVKLALARRLAQQAVVTRPMEFTKGRQTPIGLGPDPVAPGAILTIITSPQIVFRPERFVVPSDIAGLFSLVDLKVGKNSQLASQNEIPCRTFDERSVGVALKCDTAQISQQISVTVRNVSGAPATFTGTLIGESVE